jgi:hypothetical protein
VDPDGTIHVTLRLFRDDTLVQKLTLTGDRSKPDALTAQIVAAINQAARAAPATGSPQ